MPCLPHLTIVPSQVTNRWAGGSELAEEDSTCWQMKGILFIPYVEDQRADPTWIGSVEETKFKAGKKKKKIQNKPIHRHKRVERR